jgi:hypothetical protein
VNLIVSIIFLIVCYLFLKSLYKLFFAVPTARSMKRVLGITRTGKEKKDVLDYLVDAAARVFDSLSSWLGWTGSKERRDEIENNLRRAGSRDTYQTYMAKKFIFPAVALVIGFITGTLMGDVPAVSYIFKGTAAFVAITLFFYPSRELKRLIQEKNDKLVLEMPRFIRTVRYSPDNKALLHIIYDYLKCAKAGLKYDLTQLAADIQILGETKALESFMLRVNVGEVREFASVLLLSQDTREHIKMNLMFIEEKLEEKVERILDKELKKRPEILESINEVLLFSLGIVFLVPMFIYSWEGIIKMFK